jgi:hypothetical protein
LPWTGGRLHRHQCLDRSEPLYLARELGRLDPAAVQLVEYPSKRSPRAFRNQAIDGMVISLMNAGLVGFQPRIILVVDVSHGADVVVGRSGMKTCMTSRANWSRSKAAPLALG